MTGKVRKGWWGPEIKYRDKLLRKWKNKRQKVNTVSLWIGWKPDRPIGSCQLGSRWLDCNLHFPIKRNQKMKISNQYETV